MPPPAIHAGALALALGLGGLAWLARMRQGARPKIRDENHYRDLFESSPVGIWDEDWSGVKEIIDASLAQGVTDLDAHFRDHPDVLRTAVGLIQVRDFNRAGMKYFRAENRESVPATCSEYFSRVDPNRFRKAFVALEAGEMPFVDEGWTIAFDDSKIALKIIVQVAPGSEDTWSRIVVVTEEITERKLDEAALQGAIYAATEESRSKSSFLVGASHDLRQPLHAMGLFVSLLRAQTKDPERSILVDRIATSLDAVNRLFDSLLDLSRLEASAITPTFSDFPVSDLLNRMIGEFAPQAQIKGLELRAVSCDVVIRSDSTLLESILRNLLSNAVRYTPSGRILLGCRRRGGKLAIVVWDTGVGIPEGQIETVFHEFQRLPQNTETREAGLGLGLAIVDRLARLLGHRVEVGSRPGIGSMFAIEVGLGESDVHAEGESCAVSERENASLAGTAFTQNSGARTPPRSARPGSGS
jgi:signal transduction histidine kinase